MTVRDLMKMDIDIDCYDDVCEEIGIAFCGPMELTEEGEKKFAEVMHYPIELDMKHGTCIIKVDDPSDIVWKKRLRKAKEFFYSIAGYCSYDDYDKWFKDPTDE